MQLDNARSRKQRKRQDSRFGCRSFRHQFDVPVLMVQRDLHPSQLCAILSATRFETDRDEIPLLNFC
jgi:hypothetical protein